MGHKPIKACAHRGASGTHPENTVAAFEEAVRLGAEMLEFDVRRTADGKFVIMHDPTVDRTTSGQGPVAALTFDEIRALDAGEGQAVPTLDEAMAYVDRMMLNIHLYPETPGDVDAMTEVLLGRFASGSIYDRAFVASENETVLNRLHQSDPRIRLCNLCHHAQPNYVELALTAVPCQVLQPTNGNVTTDLVAAAHAQGLKVNVFYADDEPEMKRLIDCGVDGILTNYPARLLNLKAELV
jgi:glycerophosphoryl diester phosphodiesterase